MSPPTVTDKGTETRRRILEAAAQLFVERGYSATSMNDIIRESGLTKGGFYFHFASKADVASQALELLRTEMRGEILTAAGHQPRAVDQIAAIVRAAAANCIQNPSGASLGRLCIELAAEPEVEQLNPFSEWFVLTAQLLRQAQTEGDMDPGVDVEKAAYFAVTSFLGMDHVAQVSGNPAAVAEHVEDYLAFVFHALRMTAPVPAPPQL